MASWGLLVDFLAALPIDLIAFALSEDMEGLNTVQIFCLLRVVKFVRFIGFGARIKSLQEVYI